MNPPNKSNSALPDLLGLMDAAPADLVPSNPASSIDHWHSLVIIAAQSVKAVDKFIGLIEKDMRTQMRDRAIEMRDWKGRTHKYKVSFARAFSKIMQQEPTLLLPAITCNRESEIINLQSDFIKVLHVGTNHCQYTENGRHLFTSIGPYVINGSPPRSFKFDLQRERHLLWTASNILRLVIKVDKLQRVKHQWNLYTDLQACDQPHDPWGVQALTGMLGTVTNGRVGLRVGHRKRGEPIQDLHRASFLPDNLAGLMNCWLYEQENGAGPFTHALNPLFSHPDMPKWVLLEQWTQTQTPGLSKPGVIGKVP